MQAVSPHRSRAAARGRRRARAPRESGAPARGGSRGSLRTRPARSPFTRSAHSTNRSCSDARWRLSRLSYTESRMKMWWNARKSIPSRSRLGLQDLGAGRARRRARRRVRVERRRPARRSRQAGRCARPPPPDRARVRSSRSRRSIRALSSAWIVGGIQSEGSDASIQVVAVSHQQALVAQHRDELLREERIARGRLDDALEANGVERAAEPRLDQVPRSRSRRAGRGVTVCCSASSGPPLEHLGPGGAQRSGRRRRTSPSTRAGRGASSSAQCRSSIRSSTGRRLDSTSSRRRKPQKISGSGNVVSLSPISEPTRSTTPRLGMPGERLDLRERGRGVVAVDDPRARPDRLDHRPEGDALAVGEAAAAQHVAHSAAATSASSSSSRVLPTPASPSRSTERGVPVCGDLVEQRQQLVELGRAADELRGASDRRSRSARAGRTSW